MHLRGVLWVFSPRVPSFFRQRHRPIFLYLNLFNYVSKGEKCGCNEWEDKEGHDLLPGGGRTVLQKLHAHFHRL